MAEPATKIEITEVKSEGDLRQALAIREVVFIEEQRVPEGIERDEFDQDAYHVIAIENGHAVGTGRLVVLKDSPDDEQGVWARVGRMAVLKASRKNGIGSKLLSALEEEARRKNVKGLMLHAQLTSMEFYKQNGYEPEGAVFEEAGMPHLEMKKRLH